MGDLPIHSGRPDLIMATGRRCAIGCQSWPDEIIYKKCPECGEATTRCNGVIPMDSEEARSVLRHKAFDRFYEVWCSQRDQPVDGPLYLEADTEDEVEGLCSEPL